MQKCAIIKINYQHNAYLDEHNRQKIGEMPRSIMRKFWSIIDSSLHIISLPRKHLSTKSTACITHFIYLTEQIM